MSKKKTVGEPSYHALPDLHPKLIRILVQAKVLSPSAHQVSLAIRDRFNSKGERERECYEGASGNARRAGMGKKQFNSIADDLVALGLFRFGYRVFLNDGSNQYKDFSTNEEAERFRNKYEQTVEWSKSPSIVRLYKDVDRLPSPEELGLTLVDKKNHIYFAPKKIRRRGKKISRGMEENPHTQDADSSTPHPKKSDLNETNITGTKISDTNKMVSSNKKVGAEALASLPIPTNMPSSVSDSLTQLIAVFEKRFEAEKGYRLPGQQRRAVTDDESVRASVEENITTVLEAGGTFEGWVDCEYERMAININKKYRSPKLEYFGNRKSLEEYLDKLDAQRLQKSINPFQKHLSTSELQQCLSLSPEEDLTLIRYQILLRAYTNSKPFSEISTALDLLPSYSHFFKIEPKVFLYVGIKYVSVIGQRSKNVLALARRFSQEHGDMSLVSILKDKQLIKLIAEARDHLPSQFIQ